MAGCPASPIFQFLPSKSESKFLFVRLIRFEFHGSACSDMTLWPPPSSMIHSLQAQAYVVCNSCCVILSLMAVSYWKIIFQTPKHTYPIPVFWLLQSFCSLLCSSDPYMLALISELISSLSLLIRGNLLSTATWIPGSCLRQQSSSWILFAMIEVRKKIKQNKPLSNLHRYYFLQYVDWNLESRFWWD